MNLVPSTLLTGNVRRVEVNVASAIVTFTSGDCRQYKISNPTRLLHFCFEQKINTVDRRYLPDNCVSSEAEAHKTPTAHLVRLEYSRKLFEQQLNSASRDMSPEGVLRQKLGVLKAMF